MECPWGTFGSAFLHFLPGWDDVSGIVDVQKKESTDLKKEEETLGEQRRRRKDYGGGVVPKVEAEGRGPYAESPGRDEEEVGRAERERRTKKPATFLEERGFLRYGDGWEKR
ncbi:hypothetical protein NDU88_005996 [Pleurodeles waltl]|uniref:Uncharacterized protein n=1 Tax=Pleurodeles waltl TaxID=8319 RepID=A0AAV7RP19_PLEWA|nr:hypothetical protein NDU88_005996 [Pleurodeles waltl]